MSDANILTPEILIPSTPAPVTSIAVDPAAREVAVQAAIDQTKAEAAVAALDATAQPEPVPPAPEPSHGVVVPAPAPVATPGEEDVEVETAEAVDEKNPMIRLQEVEDKIAELEIHLIELIGHLAQSFGDVYKQKKDRMGA